MLLLPLSPFSAEAFGLGLGARVIGKHLPDILDFGVCGVLKLFNSSCPQSINDFRGSQNLPEDISAGTFLLNFSIGDARQKVSLIADTTTDLTFMSCQPCRDCAVEANIAVYNSSQSETFSKYTCQGSTECLGSRYTVCSSESCTYYYADYPCVSSNRFLAKDTFFVSDDNPVPVVFGCVGNKRVEIPTTAYLPQPNGRGGIIVDSVSSVTLLEESVYLAMKQEFINQVKLPQADASPYGLNLCFKICPEEHDVDVPDLTVHFVGGDLNPSNYFLKDADGGALLILNGASIIRDICAGKPHAGEPAYGI
ncbi:hypothetical protein LUZ63_015661 [Rhynchospora breviuscula]|uniref:Xylanase inhibitor N-terminal domain-containing protein n=1 Tax=Rhynchospora breviuscula TaxID=2022672 RepID=A0A9Q0CCS3_9POAL|nr:hypothetical protein LUZ63_015661 [Rhynchospora breviuscula]